MRHRESRDLVSVRERVVYMMWNKHVGCSMQRVAYLVAISGAFLKLSTLRRCHLTNPAEIRNLAKITPDPDLGRIWKNDRISAGARFGAKFRYSPNLNSWKCN